MKQARYAAFKNGSEPRLFSQISKAFEPFEAHLTPIIEFPLLFAAIIVLMAAAQLWARHESITFLPPDYKLFVFLMVKICYRLMAYRNFLISPRYAPVARNCFLLLEVWFLLQAFFQSCAIFSYLVCTWNYPFVDPLLAHADQILNFDREQFCHWVLSGHRNVIFKYAYNSLMNQFGLFVLLFSFLNDKNRLREFLLILFISLIFTVVLSGLFPAIGAESTRSMIPDLIGIRNDDIADLLAMREHSRAAITHLGGIVMFPSFHTICAITFMYACRDSVLSHLSVALNILMLISTPVFGNHYFVDMLAGLMVAYFSIIVISIDFHGIAASFLDAILFKRRKFSLGGSR